VLQLNVIVGLGLRQDGLRDPGKGKQCRCCTESECKNIHDARVAMTD
jgi:hypothetical protein